LATENKYMYYCKGEEHNYLAAAVFI